MLRSHLLLALAWIGPRSLALQLQLRKPRVALRAAVVCSAELEFALRAAIEVEDYAEAARIKKELDAAAERSAEDARVAEDQTAAELADASSIDQMLSSAGAEGLVVLHFTSVEQHALVNSLVARTAARYASSQLLGGPVCGFVQLSEVGFERLGRAELWRDPRRPDELAEPVAPADELPPGWKSVDDADSGRTYYYNSKTKETSWERPVSEARRAAAALCEARGITSLPTTQLWRGGQMLREVSAAELEAELAGLGARAPDGTNVASGTERYRDREAGSGLPSADAVDDIDFTGGVAGAGGTALDRFKGRDRGTTRSYLPDLVDKPGDDMKKGGNEPPQGPPGTLRKGPNWGPKKPTA